MVGGRFCLKGVVLSVTLLAAEDCSTNGVEFEELMLTLPLVRALSALCSLMPRKTAPRMARSATASRPPIINKVTIFSFYVVLKHYASKHNIPTWLVNMDGYFCTHTRHNEFSRVGIKRNHNRNALPNFRKVPTCRILIWQK